MAEIVLEDVSKVFADGTEAVHSLDLHIPDGKLIVLVGPSGCGKTTVLRMIAGLEDLTGGRIAIGGRVVNEVPPGDRDVAMVFQNYALYPHMTVYQNMALSLKIHKIKKDEMGRRVREAAAVLHLEDLLHKRPRELSGGQRQRVAMGRAIVREPKAFLMDEPLSNLDAKLRVQMRSEIARIQHELSTTTIYVTHDQVEAMTLGQRVAVMRDGRIQQVDTPQVLYARPDNVFVASFIGSPAMNLVKTRLLDGVVELGGHRIPLPAVARPQAPDGPIVAGIRPEAFEDASFADPSLPALDVDVLVVEELGSDTHVLFGVDAPRAGVDDQREAEEDALVAGGGTAFTARVGAATRARAGAPLRIAVDPSAFHFFDPETGARIERWAPSPAGAELVGRAS